MVCVGRYRTEKCERISKPKFKPSQTYRYPLKRIKLHHLGKPEDVNRPHQSDSKHQSAPNKHGHWALGRAHPTARVDGLSL